MGSEYSRFWFEIWLLYLKGHQCQTVMARCKEFWSWELLLQSVSCAWHGLRRESGMNEYGSASDVILSNDVEIAFAVSLQKLSEFWSPSWAVSVSLDCSVHRWRSSVDVPVRVSHQIKLQNFHLIALPMFHPHTGKIIDVVLEIFFRCFL